MTRHRNAALMLVLCGACTGSTTQMLGSQYVKSGTFGPAGGTLTVTASDSATLQGTQIIIPPGALSAPTLIQIGVTNQGVVPTNQLGPTIDFEKSGTVFAVPATVTIPVNPNGYDPSRVGVMAIEPDGSSRDITAVTVAKGGASSLATFQVSGFTHYGCHLEDGVEGSNGATGSTGSSLTGGSTTGGTITGGLDTGGSGTGGSGTGGSGTTGGSATTGGGSTAYVDGGYVSCTGEIDGGELAWLCQPGTYFCQSPRNCAQCLSDSDCANTGLPTYDPTRPRCDLDSGMGGYQNFCQPCLSDSDCAATPATPHCDLNAGNLEPPILNTGFETCGQTADFVRCTPWSCGGPDSCELDSGACAGPGGGPVQCQTDYDCSEGEGLCNTATGNCTQCFTDSDCIYNGSAAQGSSYCLQGGCSSDPGCAVDADCTGSRFGPHCITDSSAPSDYCGCGSDADCANSPDGPHCISDAGVPEQGSCSCDSTTECPTGEACRLGEFATIPPVCSNCVLDSDCLAPFVCGQDQVCRPRCDDGGTGCVDPFPICDVDRITYDVMGKNFCYQCLKGDDCPAGEDCNTWSCGTGCVRDSDCHSGEVCSPPGSAPPPVGTFGTCRPSCDAGACPAGQVCDADGAVGGGTNVCYGCRNAGDCAGGQGCQSSTHTCGACDGPTAAFTGDRGEGGGLGGPFDCPPNAVCSSYWVAENYIAGWVHGVCLQNCDVEPCLNAGDTCEVLPGFTPDHKYCFGCVQDSDCADAGTGAWCDTSIGLTFSCKPGPRP